MPVMHLTQVAGKTVANVITQDGEIASAFIGDVFKAHIAKVIAEGEGWAPDDVYKVVYRCSTWPMGWEKEYSEKYFKTKEELAEFVADYQDWAKSEDNKVEITTYEWDLGPTLIDTVCFG